MFRPRVFRSHPKVAKWQGSIAQDAVLLLEMSLRTIRIPAIRAKAKTPGVAAPEAIAQCEIEGVS